MPRGIAKNPEEKSRKISEGNKGKRRSVEVKTRISRTLKGRLPWNTGKTGVYSEAHIKKLSNASRKRFGKNCPAWLGGITPIRLKIKCCDKYKQWRQFIYLRDNFTCQKCGDKTGGNLHAHHIKSFSKLLQEVKTHLPLLDLYEGAMIYTPMWNTDNGITLCEKCHKKTKNYAGKGENRKTTVEEI